MVQKEVGDRFRAKPNSRQYNSLSIYLDYYFDIKKVLNVSRNVFIPKPNVDSIVLELVSKENKFELINKDIFFKLIKDSFRQKRKNLKNNLKNYDLKVIEEILKENDLSLSARAEQLSIEIYVKIANKISESKKEKAKISD